MSSRQRGLRFLSVGLAFALALAVLAACADEKAPQTIVNTTIGESAADRKAEVPEQKADTTVEPEVKTPEEVEQPETEEETEAEQPEKSEKGGDGGLDEEAAKELFTSATCAGCHTLSAADAVGQVGPVLDDTNLEPAQVETMIRNGGGAMPPFEGRLSNAEIKSLAQFVSESSQG